MNPKIDIPEIELLLRELLRDKFPEIKPGRIRLVLQKKQDYYMAVSLGFGGYRLFVDHSALKFSSMAFTGCLAHELCHIVELERRSFLGATYPAQVFDIDKAFKAL